MGSESGLESWADMCPTLSWTKSRGHLIVIQVYSAYEEKWLSPSLIWNSSFFYCVKLYLRFHLPVPFEETDFDTIAFVSPQIDTMRDNTDFTMEQNIDIENHQNYCAALWMSER